MSSADGEAINIAGGTPITIFELAKKVIDVCGSAKKIQPKLVPFPHGRKDVKHRFADISKMINILGFRPSVSLEEGLKMTAKWYMQKNN